MLAAPDSVHRIPASRSGEYKGIVTGIDRRQAVSCVVAPRGLHGPLRKNPHPGDAQKITTLPLTGNQWAATIYEAHQDKPGLASL